MADLRMAQDWQRESEVSHSSTVAFPASFDHHVWLHVLCQKTIFPVLPWLEENLRLWKRRTSALVEMSRRFVKRVWKPNPSGLNSIQKLFGINTIPFSSIEDWRLYKVWPWSEHCRSRSEQDLHEKETTQRSGEQRHQFECFRWITTEVSIWWLVYRSHQNAKNLHSRRNEWTYIKVKEKYWLQHPHPLYFNEC